MLAVGGVAGLFSFAAAGASKIAAITPCFVADSRSISARTSSVTLQLLSWAMMSSCARVLSVMRTDNGLI
ncbi:hypothetical protein TZ00_00730 [Agreia bicolorata]|uniref:Secreted protein n=1 Tax=Agreia bicolorata TaxID=110935 RepID=A0ABR5CIM9_9MICO|nr:hypothetical protein TZ00_00730 [Agreia bicolorata]